MLEESNQLLIKELMATVEPNGKFKILAFITLFDHDLEICVLEQLRKALGAVVSATSVLNQKIVLVQSWATFRAFGDDYLHGAGFFAFGARLTAAGWAYDLVLVAAKKSLGCQVEFEFALLAHLFHWLLCLISKNYLYSMTIVWIVYCQSKLFC